ncbi:DEAD/DEAH box helicase family protein [Gracilibacillus saliphilus]|uniref:DEAD/DEAH box helicase family protein n=1 Tax=Gracilibacillus saliphilus TaxID=543890 RepID=UPI0013D8CE56|nr:DEAD/DEAH box helicase family protein [Gracilibacillus saliphilus]
MERVSNYVTTDKVNSWKKGDLVAIKAQMGAGKSHFIKNILYAIAKRDKKKILFLIHRSRCKEQFEIELENDNKIDIITLRTYQSIENIAMKGNQFDFNKYDYIVLDEFHYFLSDAAFNNTTDISLNQILNLTRQIKICMSATGDYMTEYLEQIKDLSPKKYAVPFDFSYINLLHFFYKEHTMEEYIKLAIKNNKKSIFFINNTERAYDLHRRYKDHSLFVCSESNKYYKYVIKKKVESLLEHNRFEDLILITTSVLDSGVNIEDGNLHNIVISEFDDVGTLMQCVGRKRLQHKEDYINLFIHAMSNKQLGNKKGRYQSKLKIPEELKKHNANTFSSKYGRSNYHSDMLYDEPIEDKADIVRKKINDLMYYKTKINITEIDKMLKLGEFGYCEYISNIFEKEYNILEVDKSKDRLSAYLDSVVGERLFKEGQESLKKEFKKNDLKSRTLGINTLNGWLVDKEIPYIIIPKRTNKKRYWVVEEIDR